MKQTELIPGQKYIVEKVGVCTYQGKHDGIMELADGTIYYGGQGALKFLVTDPEPQRVVIIADGRPVIESEATKQERERLLAEKEARIDEIHRVVAGTFSQLGIPYVDSRNASYQDRQDKVYMKYPNVESISEVVLDGFTMVHLLGILERHKAINA